MTYQSNPAAGAAGADGRVQFALAGAFNSDAGLVWDTVNKTLTVQAGAASSKALIVKGAASQSANYQEWQDSTGTVVARLDSGGRLTAGSLSGAYVLAGNYYNTSASGVSLTAAPAGYTFSNSATVSNIPLISKGMVGQTGDLQQWQDSTGAVKLSVNSAGLLKWAAAGNTQTTVGAAGSASALPATPTRYLRVVDSDGTVLVVAAYLAS